MVARDSTPEAAVSPPQPVVSEPVPAAPAPRPEPEPVTVPPSPSPGDEADPGTYLALARQAEADGNLDEAIRLVKRSLVMDDDQAAVWAELSELYLKSQNFRWAQATASEAVRRDPENPKTHLQFIRAAQRTMDGDRIIREMEAAYRQFPDQPEIILVLARGYADAGNTRNARLLYNRFLERVPIDYPTRPAAEAELSLLR
jgi:tetratricopeptide (TPR) repeat protein